MSWYTKIFFGEISRLPNKDDRKPPCKMTENGKGL